MQVFVQERLNFFFNGTGEVQGPLPVQGGGQPSGRQACSEAGKGVCWDMVDGRKLGEGGRESEEDDNFCALVECRDIFLSSLSGSFMGRQAGQGEVPTIHQGPTHFHPPPTSPIYPPSSCPGRPGSLSGLQGD